MIEKGSPFSRDSYSYISICRHRISGVSVLLFVEVKMDIRFIDVDV